MLKKLKENWTVLIVTAIIGTLCITSGLKRGKNPNTEVDLDTMYSIESEHYPKAVSEKGARGVGQVMRDTWNECAEEMGVEWTYDEDAFDPNKNKEVSEYYLNTVIPRYLKYYEIPDNVETRLAAYNCGIGRLNKAYKKYGRNWKQGVPEETRNHIVKYYSRL